MDLFDFIECQTTTRPAPDGDWRPSIDPMADEEYIDLDLAAALDAEAEARALGEDMAGVPSWSVVSAKVHYERMASLLDSVDEPKRAELVRVADEAYEAARVRRPVKVSARDEE
jgi:hypothetical protein